MSKTKEALPDLLYNNMDLFMEIIDQSINPGQSLECFECEFEACHNNSWKGQQDAAMLVIRHYFNQHIYA